MKSTGLRGTDFFENEFRITTLWEKERDWLEKSCFS